MNDLPDMSLELRRDGGVMNFSGGRMLPELCSPADWPSTIASSIKQLTRRAIAERGTADGIFEHAGRRYEARIWARSPERAVGVIRVLAPDQQRAEPCDSAPRGDRREFWRRMTESISTACLSERPLALAIIHIEGLSEISQLMDMAVSDRVIGQALLRLDTLAGGDAGEVGWHVGVVGDHELALVVDAAQRDSVEQRVRKVCENLSQPLNLGDAEFHLKPYAGVAILGQDATAQGSLLEHARAATTEARRFESSEICFFSDTMKLRSLTRIDIAQELRDAIANGEIRLRYRGRHDLETGRVTALVGYLQWTHPIRGEIRPAHFLGAAAATGLSTLLSRSLLSRLRHDFQAISARVAADVRISYGALRHHVLDDTFMSDVAELLTDNVISPERLELRISERTYVARESDEWQSVAAAGVQLVVDEVGRKMSSIDRLARAPIWGLQLDRASAVLVEQEDAAAKVCAAVIGIARALRLVPLATGVDSPAQRDALRKLGCVQGIGDYFEKRHADVLRQERTKSARI